MGEKEEVKLGGAEKKAEEGGEKKTADVGGEKKDDEETNIVVLRLDLHCEGCGKKVTRFISQLEGVLTVKADCSAKKLTVMGNVDPFFLRERVETKTRKKVELISYPQPKKGDEKSEKKTEDNKKGDGEEQKLPKQDVVITPATVMMKIKLHCDGCAQKITRVILKNIDGVSSVTTDLQKDLVTVTGTMAVNKLVPYLKEKLKRAVDIVLPKRIEAENGDKKGKESSGVQEKKTKQVNGIEDGPKQEKKGHEDEPKQEKKNDEEGDKKNEGDVTHKDEGGPKAGGTMIELSKTEYHGHNPETHYAMLYDHNFVNQDYGMSSYHYQDFSTHYTRKPPSPPSPTYLSMNHQTFVDENENPSGCYIM